LTNAQKFYIAFLEGVFVMDGASIAGVFVIFPGVFVIVAGVFVIFPRVFVIFN